MNELNVSIYLSLYRDDEGLSKLVSKRKVSTSLAVFKTIKKTSLETNTNLVSTVCISDGIQS